MIRIFILLSLIVIKVIGLKYKMLTMVTGEVSQDNFTYCNISYGGTLLLELTSVTGDCDLYVSQKTVMPTYDPHNNCLQSVTCGLDSVIVPESFKRPLGLGVFGHPSHELCQFVLLINRVEEPLDIDLFNPSEGTELSKFVANIMPKLKNYHYHSVHDGEILEIKDNEDEVEEEEVSFYWLYLKYLYSLIINVSYFFDALNYDHFMEGVLQLLI